MQNPTPVWLSIRDVAERYSVSCPTVTRWAKSGTIPAPKKVGESAVRWHSAELDAHDARLIEEAAQ